jgi:hypothetical protein
MMIFHFSPGDGQTMNDMPSDPVSDLAMGAAQIHELYAEYVAAGFTKKQAMSLVLTMLTESLRQQRRD